MSSYVSGAELMAVASAAEATTEDIWDDYAESASRILDLACEVEPDFFAAAGENDSADERTFYPENIDMFRLPPFVDELITVKIDGEELEDDEWRVSGANTGQQYLMNLAGDFESDKPLTISAIWGFDTVPAEVKAITKEIGVYLWRQRDPLFASQSNFEKLYDNLSPTANAVIKKIRDKYSMGAY